MLDVCLLWSKDSLVVAGYINTQPVIVRRGAPWDMSPHGPVWLVGGSQRGLAIYMYTTRKYDFQPSRLVFLNDEMRRPWKKVPYAYYYIIESFPP